MGILDEMQQNAQDARRQTLDSPETMEVLTSILAAVRQHVAADRERRDQAERD